MDDEHPNNVIDRALHLLQGEANAAAEGMKDVAQHLMVSLVAQTID